jgi:glyoxylase-like metal-dependent hydrolase (beta-lactamase superfamily II)
MERRMRVIVTIMTLVLSLLQCTTSERLEVKRQIVGAIETNCYLLYDVKSREAAMFDVGGPVDSLVAIIRDEGLNLKYVFFTHGHPDHMVGLSSIRGEFPEALVCLHKRDYDDLATGQEWLRSILDPEELEVWRNDPGLLKLLEFEAESFEEPDVFLEDDQVFKLGNHEVRTIHSPGHSPGGVCFHVGNMLFSGDVLFHRRVGRTDIFNSSREDMVRSVRRLYNLLPDETIVYPGHEDLTDIGSEKRENEEITMEKADFN